MQPRDKILAGTGAFTGAAVPAIGVMAASIAVKIATSCGQPFNIKAPLGTRKLAIVAYGANGDGGAVCRVSRP